MASKKLYIVELTKDGFKGTASGSGRAAVVGPTQKFVADELHDRFPEASVVAARVRAPEPLAANTLHSPANTNCCYLLCA